MPCISFDIRTTIINITTSLLDRTEPPKWSKATTMSSSTVCPVSEEKALLINGRDFNKTVNMTAEELEKWLKGSSSKESGWSKSDGSGESVGHERYRHCFCLLPMHRPDNPIVAGRSSRFSKRTQRMILRNMTRTICNTCVESQHTTNATLPRKRKPSRIPTATAIRA
jgi:hypothetical protein